MTVDRNEDLVVVKNLPIIDLKVADCLNLGSHYMTAKTHRGDLGATSFYYSSTSTY